MAWRKGLPKLGNSKIEGFPLQARSWCNGELKRAAFTDSQCEKVIGVLLSRQRFSNAPQNEGQKINIVHYIGIAADEPERIKRHIIKDDKILPLVQIGWDEELCGLEAQYLDMLSPTYNSSTRDGCWFCHNQTINQLRNLRRNYPELWEKLLVLDNDSPVAFHADGHTVHDFDRRFALEDEGLIDPKAHFKWAMLDDDCLNYSLFLM